MERVPPCLFRRNVRAFGRWGEGERRVQPTPCFPCFTGWRTRRGGTGPRRWRWGANEEPRSAPEVVPGPRRDSRAARPLRLPPVAEACGGRAAGPDLPCLVLPERSGQGPRRDRPRPGVPSPEPAPSARRAAALGPAVGGGRLRPGVPVPATGRARRTAPGTAAA